MPTETVSVLLVLDDPSFIEALTLSLGREGFAVTVARDGAAALDSFDASPPSIVLLDALLPEVSGIEVCRELRSRSDVPVILVADGDRGIDAVVGLDAGADDCITRPERTRELVARMRAVLRRRHRPPARRPHPDVLAVGDVSVDSARHEVCVRGEVVAVPLKEFELLVLLLQSAGRVLTRRQLMEALWGAPPTADTKTLDVHIKRLRAKVEPDPSNPRRIVNIRGLGYKYVPPGEPS